MVTIGIWASVRKGPARPRGAPRGPGRPGAPYRAGTGVPVTAAGQGSVNLPDPSGLKRSNVARQGFGDKVVVGACV